jgi:hypothetical protein
MPTPEEVQQQSNPAAAAGKLAGQAAMTAAGGYAQAALGGIQALYGAYQAPKARAEFEAAKASAPSLETPSQFYENYRNAYDAELARMETDAIQSNLATSVQALQGAGGRSLVGGLNSATRSAQDAQNRMLAQERQSRMVAGQQLAAAEERAIGRKEARSQQDIAYANQAYQAAVGNVASGLGSLGEGLMYGLSATDFSKVGEKIKPIANKAKEGVGNAADFVGDKAVQAGKFVGKKANALKERVDYEMDMMPERVNQFKQQRAFNKTMKQAQKRGNPPTMINSIAPKSINPSDVYTPNPASMMQPVDMTKPAPSFASLSPVSGNAVSQTQQNNQVMEQLQQDANTLRMFAPMIQGKKQMSPAQKGWMKWYDKYGSYIPMFENGGMMTQGAFNHNSNPIHLVQNGEKVGEATGGEYILNPQQAKAVSKESTYARKLFKQFAKKAKK